MATSPPDLADIAQLVRIPSPAPAPQALAYDGESLWLGSWETERIYGIDPKQGRVFEETAAPGRPVGGVNLGDELRFVCAENGEADNRIIRRYVPGHGFKTHESQPCPDDTGSFLGYDGERLWLSQRHAKRVLELDAQNRVARTLPVGEEIVGLAWIGDRLYFSTWLGRERGGCRIAYLEPHAPDSPLTFVAQSPFVAISLALDGERLWTNDFKHNEIVAFAIPA